MFTFDWSIFWAILLALITMEGLQVGLGQIIIWRYNKRAIDLQNRVSNGEPAAIEEMMGLLNNNLPPSVLNSMGQMPTTSGAEAKQADHGTYL